MTCFLPASDRCLTPPSWGTHCDINAIYTSLKSTFSGLQFRRWYGTIFIRLIVIAPETREMSRNSKRIWPYSSSRSSTVIDLACRPYNLYCVGADVKPCSINQSIIDLGVNGKPICDFLLIVTVAISATVFEIFTLIKVENCWFYPSLPCLTPPLGVTPWNFRMKRTPQKLEGCGYRRHRKMKIS